PSADPAVPLSVQPKAANMPLETSAAIYVKRFIEGSRAMLMGILRAQKVFVTDAGVRNESQKANGVKASIVYSESRALCRSGSLLLFLRIQPEPKTAPPTVGRTLELWSDDRIRVGGDIFARPERCLGTFAVSSLRKSGSCVRSRVVARSVARAHGDA